MTWRDFLFGRSEPTPSEAARVLGAVRRQADRERIAQMTEVLRWEVAHGITAPLGWRQ